MSRPRWNTKQDTIVKLCFIEEIEACRVTKEVILPLYLSLVQEEENTVKLHTFYNACLTSSALFSGLPFDELDASLLRDTKETHYMILHMLVSLFFSTPPPPKSEEVSGRAQRKLVSAAKRLGYVDILWLYASRLVNPERKAIELLSVNERLSDLFLNFLYAQKESTIKIVTPFEVYELRVTSLFRSVMSLLLREKRYTKAHEAYLFMKTVLHVGDPLFYLSDRTKVLYDLCVSPIKT